jgi:DNA-binding transcriptional ArsR family regulator
MHADSDASRLLQDRFNLAMVRWLSGEPRSFADVVAAFGLAPSFVRMRLQSLIKAGLVRTSQADPIDYARRIWTVRKALRAAGFQPTFEGRKTASRRSTIRSDRSLGVQDVWALGAITADDV